VSIVDIYGFKVYSPFSYKIMHMLLENVKKKKKINVITENGSEILLSLVANKYSSGSFFFHFSQKHSLLFTYPHFYFLFTV